MITGVSLTKDKTEEQVIYEQPTTDLGKIKVHKSWLMVAGH